MSLKQQAFKAGRWTALSALLVTSTQLVQVVVLARLLAPEDFGLMAITSSFIAVLALFADFGLSRAIIHFDNIPREALSSLYWVNLGIGILLMIALASTAPAIATLFKSPDLTPVLQAVSLIFPLTTLGQQFRVIAEKELQFKALAVNEISAAILGLSLAIAVALNGGGVFALVTGVLATATISSVLAWLRLSHGYRPHMILRLEMVKPYLRFGGYLTGEAAASTLQRQADIFIGGLISSPTAMGLFSLPRDICLRAALIINPILTRVGFPVMSRVQHDRDKIKSIYLQTLRMAASVNFPIYMAFALFSEEIVILLFGEQWQASAKFLLIFAAFGLVRSTSNPVGSLLYAVGQAKRAFWWNIALLLLLPPLFFIGGSLNGLTGLAVTMLIAHVAIVLPLWWFLVRPACGASLQEYVRPLAAPLSIALLSCACAYLATVAFDQGIIRLAVGLTVGLLAYLLLSTKFNRPWISAVADLLLLKR